MYDIKDMVGGTKLAHFKYFRTDELWYETDSGFLFPVPLSDTGDTLFPAEDKAMIFMKWIKKQIKLLESATV